MTIKAGHVFTAPCGTKGYTLTKDLNFLYPITKDHFEPFGGMDEAQGGEQIPHWLTKQIADAYKDKQTT